MTLAQQFVSTGLSRANVVAREDKGSGLDGRRHRRVERANRPAGTSFATVLPNVAITLCEWIRRESREVRT